MLNEPSLLVVAESSRFVATARALTTAPGRTAPLLSVTVPFIDPRVCWAHDRLEQRVKTASAIKRAPEESRGHTKELSGECLTAEPPFMATPLMWLRYSRTISRDSSRSATKLLKSR